MKTTKEPCSKGTATRAANVKARKAERAVRFQYVNPRVTSVCLAGTFNDWTPEEMLRSGESRWVKELLLTPGTYEYRYVVDGLWICDPVCPESVPNPYGERNSLLTIAPMSALSGVKRNVKLATRAEPVSGGGDL